MSSSCSRAASNSAASSREEAEQEEQGNVDDSSKTKRHAESTTTSSSAAVSAAAASPTPAVTYVAPLSTTVHRLKRLSLFSCLLTTAAAPTLAATEAMPPAARAAAAVGIAGFGLFTTGLLHWFVGPYVHELTWQGRGGEGSEGGEDDDAIELTTLDFFGARRRQRLPLSRVAAPPDGSVHPQATFSDSATGKLYYVDVDNFVSVSAGASGSSGGGGAERERAAAALLERLLAAEGTKAEEEGEKER